MNGIAGFLWTFFGVEAIIFIAVGILIFKRKKNRAFRVRSPTIVQISHWSNLIENLVVIYALEIDESNLNFE